MRLVGLELVTLVMEQVGVAEEQQLASLVVATAGSALIVIQVPSLSVSSPWDGQVEHARLAGRLHRRVGG